MIIRYGGFEGVARDYGGMEVLRAELFWELA